MAKVIYVVEPPLAEVKEMVINEDGEIYFGETHLYNLSDEGEVNNATDYADAFRLPKFYERKLDDAAGDEPFFSFDRSSAERFLKCQLAYQQALVEAGLDEESVAQKRQALAEATRSRFGF